MNNLVKELDRLDEQLKTIDKIGAKHKKILNSFYIKIIMITVIGCFIGLTLYTVFANPYIIYGMEIYNVGLLIYERVWSHKTDKEFKKDWDNI